MKQKTVTLKKSYHKLWVQGRAFYTLSEPDESPYGGLTSFKVTPCRTVGGIVHDVPYYIHINGDWYLEDCDVEISVFEMLEVEQDTPQEPIVAEPELPIDFAVSDPNDGTEYVWTNLQ